MKQRLSEVLSLLVVVQIILASDHGLVKCSLQQSKRCSKKDVTINQVLLGRRPSGIPIFLFEIMNQCLSARTIMNVHLHCGEFSSNTRIKPEIFKRLTYDNCLVNNGVALTPGQVLSFKYSTTRMYPFSVSYLRVYCSI